MNHEEFIIFMFESTFDPELKILDVDNNIDVDTFTYVYDHTHE